MFFVYPAIIYQEDDGYWAEVPDLEGCLTQGDDTNEIMANLKEAMEGYIICLFENNMVIPKASDIYNMNNRNNSFKTLVTIDLDLNE
ncbi:MAG: type II toxin-antitoxin system HicB family antitoxin [Peptostreptococcus sp.]|uniref:type II toxin-antitoxin system HicB family antitoxin n=1 Tax=Peptostreptococcus sp. TaxID=1262 RepID=UPI002FC739E8